MNKKTCLISVGCLILGLLLGIGGTYIFSLVQMGKDVANGLVLLKEIEIADAGRRAFEAYQHESAPVGIYALSQHLVTLKKAQEIGGESPVFMNRLHILKDLMLTHARLAKLYAESGQTNLSTEHVAEALRFAEATGKFPAVTNQPTLTALVAMFDERDLP